ncbi:hypothetical protein MYP_4312 [Sporocytophaga myxococcoides]|uniref:Uncharacterized protein n=1 Tax=Sporocytophaga myxococcoides TaxID=153721 RepID=A0A098LL17_9BACT|nr:hypothetical protein [Sporocytophaga myxococcoides]GAL87082.1 hypothetical protein MYP_4312 [Sporocytophaga myxococcoides]
MGISDTIKNVGESVTQKGSAVEQTVDVTKDVGSKEGKLVQQAEGALSDAVSPIAAMGTDAAVNAVVAFLKTEEGKKVIVPIAKHLLKKYWWAVAGIAAFEVIGIFATIRFSLSRR